MSVSCVWQYWERLTNPPRMRCQLCSAVLATLNAGNAKKHMRYKHLDTYTKVQLEDERVRDQLKRSDDGQIVGGAQKRKRKSTSSLESGGLTIEQLTSLLIPPSINFDAEETSHTQNPLESLSVAVESTANADEPLELNKKLKLRSVELVFDVEGSESIRLSLPCNQESTTVASILAQLI
ncbi:hypothetical protein M3Y95_00495300 [Aphelenchoides besseyi]|nr:hypothetical protein M3Y95_00495300 [Aphelenchoides besseyi]